MACHEVSDQIASLAVPPANSAKVYGGIARGSRDSRAEALLTGISRRTLSPGNSAIQNKRRATGTEIMKMDRSNIRELHLSIREVEPARNASQLSHHSSAGEPEIRLPKGTVDEQIGAAGEALRFDGVAIVHGKPA